jgi:broad specificity phosphatase PhoE
MQQQHASCDNDRCPACYDDAMALECRLIALTGDTQSDLLGKYHSWLARNGIPNETKGWPSAESYDDNNIAKFCAELKGDQS